MDKHIKIAVLDNEVLARHLGARLKEKNIPHIMKTYRDSAYDGMFQAQKGWGHVEAPAKFEQEILAILKDISNQ